MTEIFVINDAISNGKLFVRIEDQNDLLAPFPG